MTKNVTQLAVVAMMIATSITALSIAARPAEAIGDARCGIGDVQSDLASSAGSFVGQGTSALAQINPGVGDPVSDQSTECSNSVRHFP